MADSGDIDAALSQKLVNDATLMGLMPDGVYFDVAKKNATRFVIVSLLSALDEQEFDGRAYESPVYLVKAVALSTTGANVKAAAHRIDTLLDRGTLIVPGFTLMSLLRVERFRAVEVDEENDSRWQHRGGHYQIFMSPQ